jgi:outer membrane protein assembly factor BamB
VFYTPFSPKGIKAIGENRGRIRLPFLTQVSFWANSGKNIQGIFECLLQNKTNCKMRIGKYLPGLLFTIFILSCSDKDDPAPGIITAQASLVATTTTCDSYGIGGSYAINEALTSSHSIGAKINVTKAGSYTIHTDTVNGYSFTGSGTFAKTGEQNVILLGSGTPVMAGRDAFTITFGESACQINITVADKTDYSSRIMLATGQAHMADYYTVYALDGNKKILWRKTGFSDIPAVKDGIAYLTIDDNLQAVNIVTGELIWENTTVTRFNSAIAHHEGNLYISGSNGSIYGVNAADGAVLWEYFSGTYGVISSSPTVVDNVIYVGGNGGKVFALNLDGTEKKVYAIEGVTSSVRSSPAVVNNVIYFGNDNGYLYAVNAADGVVQWSRNVGVTGEQSPSITDGKVYIMGEEKLFCLDASNGSVVWEYASENAGNDWSSPIVKNGIVYASGMANGLQAFNAATGQELWHNYSSGQSADMDPVVFANHVYITGAGGISAVNATSGATLWNYGYIDPWSASNTVSFDIPAVVYDVNTKEVAYPATSGNVH